MPFMCNVCNALALFSVALDFHRSFITQAQHTQIHFCHFRHSFTDAWICFATLVVSVVVVLLKLYDIIASETDTADFATAMAATTLFLLTGRYHCHLQVYIAMNSLCPIQFLHGVCTHREAIQLVT